MMKMVKTGPFFCNKTVLIYMTIFLIFVFNIFHLLLFICLFVYFHQKMTIWSLFLIVLIKYMAIFFIGPFLAPKTIKKFGAKNWPVLIYYHFQCWSFFYYLFVFGEHPKKALIHDHFRHSFWCQKCTNEENGHHLDNFWCFFWPFSILSLTHQIKCDMLFLFF